MKGVLTYIRDIAWLKTIYFNFKYFPFSQAVKLPVFIFRHTDLYGAKGKIQITCPVRPGLIKIGVPELYSLDMKSYRTKWKVDGNVIVNGPLTIGRGCCIRVLCPTAELTFGADFLVTGHSNILCQKQIRFGNDCLLSWDILIMDTDFHQIVDSEKKVINPPSPVMIGNHVWIGCRTTILKGVNIADNVTVAANSMITHSIQESNCIVAGNGKSSEVIKHNVNWEHTIVK